MYKFRIIEKIKLSGKKWFIPQVGLYTRMGTKGHLWWKKPSYDYVYFGLKPLPENGIMIDYYPNNVLGGHGFETFDKANEYLNQFKNILRSEEDKEKDRLFQEEIKIIDIY